MRDYFRNFWSLLPSTRQNKFPVWRRSYIRNTSGSTARTFFICLTMIRKSIFTSKILYPVFFPTRETSRAFENWQGEEKWQCKKSVLCKKHRVLYLQMWSKSIHFRPSQCHSRSKRKWAREALRLRETRGHALKPKSVEKGVVIKRLYKLVMLSDNFYSMCKRPVQVHWIVALYNFPFCELIARHTHYGARTYR